SYPHSTSDKIRVIETHISVIFLTGDFAYKLKKPLDLGFLDFTTLEKRKFYCEEELRLNSIFAPEIYIEVLPVYEKEGKFSFQQKGKVAEYILKMRQFDQEQILSSKVESGDVSPELFTQLAQKLAYLHQKANSDQEISSYASAQAVQKIAEQNFNQTEAYIGKCISEESFENIRKSTLGFLDKNKALFETRQKSGKIRECHGDLHLNNICIYKGEIQFFDRIEFNKEFRNIDVVYDLAFLIMDLHYRKQYTAANRLMNEYFEQSGDYEGAALLPFYACVRAYIRGKVIAFRLKNQEIQTKERNEIIAEAKAYFDLAESYTKTEKTALWIMSGLSGSGKSTVARKIAEEKQFLIIRSDALRKHLTGVPLYEKGPQEIYKAEVSQETYNTLIKLAEFLTNRGVSVILDARFDKRNLRIKAMQLAEEKQLDFKIIYCQANTEELKKRLKLRSGDVSDADASLIDQQAKTFEEFTDSEKVFVDTSVS
ncbi:MAG: AAA family ATPase, partial [Chitinophagales bacterium]